MTQLSMQMLIQSQVVILPWRVLVLPLNNRHWCTHGCPRVHMIYASLVNTRLLLDPLQHLHEAVQQGTILLSRQCLHQLLCFSGVRLLQEGVYFHEGVQEHVLLLIRQALQYIVNSGKLVIPFLPGPLHVLPSLMVHHFAPVSEYDVYRLQVGAALVLARVGHVQLARADLCIFEVPQGGGGYVGVLVLAKAKALMSLRLLVSFELQLLEGPRQ
ncbi:hypothetical protein FGO68_gene15930 [Halteria grandinella]|uniref:Uncharacterized protein n=1 Tax=Halteria grandinella TaxID=5974 RepID=A0A8J8NBV0_HALGN|nr:hypothetical protein FGO68_gene15930 [Halteria grandinella]